MALSTDCNSSIIFYVLKIWGQGGRSYDQAQDAVATDTLLGSFDIETIEVETIMFQTGYLTIKKKE
ncbi:hypothetical protein [uncultured Desulfobacter sp.]|uniref:hypothetical protein n=1 Tax=uncultured Desulfobacter sp. TaxID=240139 RepID=UPI002AAB3F80|nr:hypothetical protein [uncultured Desulfobacter sp.]